MTNRELMQQALEALEEARNKADWIGMSEEGWDKVMQQVDEYVTHRINPAITALRERLAQPVQEIVAWHHPECQGECIACLIERAVQDAYGTQGRNYLLRHVTPQPRQWQGLTDEAIWLEYQRFWPFHPAEEPTLAKDIVKFARAIEAKLKEKNT